MFKVSRLMFLFAAVCVVFVGCSADPPPAAEPEVTAEPADTAATPGSDSKPAAPKPQGSGTSN